MFQKFICIYVGDIMITIEVDKKTCTGAMAGAVMMIGHPKYRYSRIPLRNTAKVIWT